MPEKQNLPILEALRLQRQSRRHRFHVPSHTACPGDYWARYDLTELPGLDQLLAPRGCIEEAQVLAAELFLADRTFFLVNGSTAGMAAAVFALCRRGDTLLLGRNCHRSVAAGLIISGADPCFIPVPAEKRGIPLNLGFGAVAAALSKMEDPPAGILVTSPNYWGIGSPLPELAEAAQGFATPLVVDEAHGGHFIFHPALPGGAAQSGADLWVNSAHKTLGALTPGAYLHLREGGRIDTRRLVEGLSLLQTSSPPYPVLLSLDLARGWLADRGESAFDEALESAQRARQGIGGLRRFRCLEQSELPGELQLDPLRLTVCWDGLDLDGYRLSGLLHGRYGIEVELAGSGYIVALVHPGLSGEAVPALLRALQDIELRHGTGSGPPPPGSYPLPRKHLTPGEAVDAPARQVPLRQAAGLVSAQLVTPFPPGVPVLYPGEEIPEELIARLEADFSEGVHFQDLAACSEPLLAVVEE